MTPAQVPEFVEHVRGFGSPVVYVFRPAAHSACSPYSQDAQNSHRVLNYRPCLSLLIHVLILFAKFIFHFFALPYMSFHVSTTGLSSSAVARAVTHIVRLSMYDMVILLLMLWRHGIDYAMLLSFVCQAIG